MFRLNIHSPPDFIRGYEYLIPSGLLPCLKQEGWKLQAEETLKRFSLVGLGNEVQAEETLKGFSLAGLGNEVQAEETLKGFSLAGLGNEVASGRNPERVKYS
ncbi:MAG: hypothetical protein IPH04_14255 [Saprospirales bacterium]|nr:hypothetical protein [Saprospirales bacterium]